MAKSGEPARVYSLKITLQGVKPPVWRRVEVTDCPWRNCTTSSRR